LSLVPLAQLSLLAGQEHGRTIPLADNINGQWSAADQVHAGELPHRMPPLNGGMLAPAKPKAPRPG
jgi:hypothetical protein